MTVIVYKYIKIEVVKIEEIYGTRKPLIHISQHKKQEPFFSEGPL